MKKKVSHKNEIEWKLKKYIHLDLMRFLLSIVFVFILQVNSPWLVIKLDIITKDKAVTYI